ncbi:MAG: ferrous iron transport protein B [Bacteroidia bacterium]
MSLRIKVALVGNPNSGKSSLFNALTGMNQKIANFPGVTVDKKTGTCTLVDAQGKNFVAEITDLPGTYSLYPKALDEKIPFQVLCDSANPDYPDLIIVVADGTNLKRSLFLCSQVIDLKIPMLLAINMIDLVKASGLNIDFEKLNASLGVKAIGINARKNEGIEELKREMINAQSTVEADFLDCRNIAPEVVDTLRSHYHFKSNYAAFLIANNYNDITVFKNNTAEKNFVESLLKEKFFDSYKLQAIETLERYKVITKVMEACVTNPLLENKASFSSKIDRVLTHSIWGYVSFLAILFIMFQAIFTWAKYPMEFVDTTFAYTSQWLSGILPDGMLNDLLVNGVLAGLGGVIIFIPQIALLFAFIAILEDTGYMARVSFIMDKLMRTFGLNGRSVIPLVSGVACAVPAIMSTRTIQNWKERLITILVVPLMSCSARLPVYTLLIALIIPDKMLFGFINTQGLVLMLMYLIGFFAALFASFVLKFIIKSKEKSYYIMEMPVYRAPRWSNVLYTMLDKVKVFLFDAGKVIVAISIILWVLSSYGPSSRYNVIEKKYETAFAKTGADSTLLTQQMQSEKLESSYAGIMGKVLEPVIRPLGFDWKIGIALITSFAAREVFVGTMSTIYSVGKDNENLLTVRDKMRAEKNPETGEPFYSLAVGISLMLFYAFAMQCMSTLAVVKRETGSWTIPVIQFLYMGALAYVASLIAFQLLK